jgi:hypothetical protein
MMNLRERKKQIFQSAQMRKEIVSLKNNTCPPTVSAKGSLVLGQLGPIDKERAAVGNVQACK